MKPIDNTQHRKMRERLYSFHGQKCSVLKGYSGFERTSRKMQSQFKSLSVCKPKSNCFNCETSVKRISLFSHFSILAVVYSQSSDIRWWCIFHQGHKSTAIVSVLLELQSPENELKVVTCMFDHTRTLFYLHLLMRQFSCYQGNGPRISPLLL